MNDKQDKQPSRRFGPMMKRLIGYYKPYRKIFYTDMFFALLSAVAAMKTIKLCRLGLLDALKTIGCAAAP